MRCRDIFIVYIDEPSIIELFYAIIPTLFLCFLLICYPYISLHFNVFILVHVTFFLNRCMKYWLKNH